MSKPVDHLTHLARLHERLVVKSDALSDESDVARRGDRDDAAGVEALYQTAAAWLVGVGEAATWERATTAEGAAFQMALVLDVITRVIDLLEPPEGDTLAMRLLRRAERMGLSVQAFLDGDEPANPQTTDYLAGKDWHGCVADSLGGVGLGGRIRLDEAS